MLLRSSRRFPRTKFLSPTSARSFPTSHRPLTTNSNGKNNPEPPISNGEPESKKNGDPEKPFIPSDETFGTEKARLELREEELADYFMFVADAQSNNEKIYERIMLQSDLDMTVKCISNEFNQNSQIINEERRPVSEILASWTPNKDFLPFISPEKDKQIGLYEDVTTFRGLQSLSERMWTLTTKYLRTKEAYETLYANLNIINGFLKEVEIQLIDPKEPEKPKVEVPIPKEEQFEDSEHIRHFRHVSDFDTNGLFYWLRNQPKAKNRIISMSFSHQRGWVRLIEGPATWYQFEYSPALEEILCGQPYTRLSWGYLQDQWVIFDLGPNKLFRCSDYTIRTGSREGYLNHWRFEGKCNENEDWKLIHEMKDGYDFKKGFAPKTFKTDGPDSTSFFRYFRFIQFEGGKDGKGSKHSLGGIELYGQLNLQS